MQRPSRKTKTEKQRKTHWILRSTHLFYADWCEKSIVECESEQIASLGNFQIFKIFQSARGMAIGHRLGWKSN
jgi:hypothetical protein